MYYNKLGSHLAALVSLLVQRRLKNGLQFKELSDTKEYMLGHSPICPCETSTITHCPALITKVVTISPFLCVS